MLDDQGEFGNTACLLFPDSSFDIEMIAVSGLVPMVPDKPIDHVKLLGGSKNY
jgi:hypothetical protein